MQSMLSKSKVINLSSQFDLEWDLKPDYQGFEKALEKLGVFFKDVFSKNGTKNPLPNPVLRCLLDMCDRQFDLTRASLREPDLEAAFNGSWSEWPEEKARAGDVLGRLAYRRGEYVLAEEWFEKAVHIAKDTGATYLIPDLTSNWLRARFELKRLSLSKSTDSSMERYEKALEEADWSKDASRVTVSLLSREKILKERGVSSLLHNIALEQRNVDNVEAERWHKQAEKINRTLEDGYRLAQTQLNLAHIYVSRAKENEASWRKAETMRKAETILKALSENQAWPRGRCFALQNLAKLYHELDDHAQAGELYKQAWQLYKNILPDARDIAFEEWTLLGWWEVAESDKRRRELYSLASDALGRMRGNLRHVLFRRNYGVRVSKLIEKGLPFAGSSKDQATELGRWSAQEISDLPQVMHEVDDFMDGVDDFRKCDQSVRRAVKTANSKCSSVVGDTQRIDDKKWLCIGKAVQKRHVQYLKRIEERRLHVSNKSEPWNVGQLQKCLKSDSAVAAYFWPRSPGEQKFASKPRVFVINHNEVRMEKLSAVGFADYHATEAPTRELRVSIFKVLVQPVLKVVSDLSIKSLYLIPYGRLFGLPIHCAQSSRSDPLLFNDPRFDRVLYSASLRQLTKTLKSDRFGEYGDLADVRGQGLATIDPANDLKTNYNHVKEIVKEMALQKRVVAQLGEKATYDSLLSALSSATWWAYAGHGYLPKDRDIVNKDKAEEAQIGAVLELADGVVEDLDLLLRSGANSLKFCVLSACVSAGLKISEGNELAGFVRALKARGCGPVMLAFWQVSAMYAAMLLAGLLKQISDTSGNLQVFNALRKTLDDAAFRGKRAMSPDVVHSGMFGVYV